MIKDRTTFLLLAAPLFFLSQSTLALPELQSASVIQEKQIDSISSLGNIAVAVGNTKNGDAILVSDNGGSTWMSVAPATTGNELNSIASSGKADGSFVAVGTQGDVEFSDDGLGKVWNKAALPAEVSRFDFTSVAYGDHTFAAAASSGSSNGSRILISRDGGKSWEIGLAIPDQILFSITYTNGEYVAFGDKKIYFTKDLNAGWSSQDLNFRGDSILNLAYGNDQYIGVGHGMGYGVIYQSQHGLFWDMTVDGDYPIDWSGIAFGDGKFVATSKNGHIYLSKDGSTWTDNGAVTDSLSSVYFSNAKNIFLAVGNDLDGNQKIFKSMDGLSWQSVEVPLISSTLRSVAMNG